MKIDQTFMNHPFWTRFMSINVDLPEIDTGSVPEFLQTVAEGFYPISYYSYYSFNRFAELTPYQVAEETARFIAETENGMHPLLGKVPYKGIPHYQMLKKMISSLDNETDIALPHPEQYNFFSDANQGNSSDVKTLAYCNLIEHTAVWVIHYYQEFVAKWQVKYKIPNNLIFRVYLDEHNLTEGDEAEEQHIRLLEKMNAEYKKELDSLAYREATDHLNQAACRHFDMVLQKLAPFLSISSNN